MIVWIIFAGIVMPIWLGDVGFPRAPSVPNFNSMSLVGHVVYAVILGALLPVVRDR